MRHADSEDPKQLPGVRDHDRPITASGLAAAKDIADQIKAASWLPDVFICSNAVRSRQTFEAIRDQLPEADYADIHFLGSLYTISQLDGQTRAHLQEVVVAEASAKHSTVLCLGHNKGWEEAASSYAGETIKLGNCYAALLEGSGNDWSDAFKDDAQWKLVSVLRPKE
jgi:polyadenylate-binding protein